MHKNLLITGKEIYNHRVSAEDNDYAAAYDRMIARRTAEQQAREAQIDGAAHCNQGQAAEAGVAN